MNKVPKSADSEAFGMIPELRLAGRGPRGRGEAALHFLGSPQAAGLGDGARPGAAPSTPHAPLRPAAPGLPLRLPCALTDRHPKGGGRVLGLPSARYSCGHRKPPRERGHICEESTRRLGSNDEAEFRDV